MRKQKMISYVSLWTAEVIAILYDSYFYILRNSNIDETFWILYELAPLFIIGIMIVIGLNFGRDFNLHCTIRANMD